MSLFSKKFLGFSRKGAAQRKRSFLFSWLCMPGEGEAMSALLASSLRRNARCQHELVVGLPDAAYFGRASLKTLSFLKDMGARFADVRNPLGPEAGYAAKAALLATSMVADKVILLDADMLCTGPFDDEGRFYMAVNARPADEPCAAATPAVWRRAYDDVMLEQPAAQAAGAASGGAGPPYFSSSFVAMNKPEDVSAAWLYCARKLGGDAALPRDPRWLEQASLSLALQMLNQPCDELDERYGFPVPLRPIPQAARPFFAHYASPGIALREPLVAGLIRSLVQEHDALADLLGEGKGWPL
jgi:hypothetical protein